MTASAYQAMDLLQSLEAPSLSGLQSALDRTAALCSTGAYPAAEDERRELLRSVVGQIRKNCLPCRPLSLREQEEVDACLGLLRHLTESR